ncbi:hypothetical protein BDK51DRAFT_49437 [Blyttiomyces helicus]|uniref:Uncharacterized protein n=1 Tax=Blyttiomyces helicus TaxID=388810 RepID=A0A4P9W887_9FUNG|nr:hypothetical protein BDK51DRAFT_49437 [Blyttiomyces helicus]|eukprot:RKO88312.1 hypothetical protein BDK51DRAFT_49437 [Blyttiomyces helicus]
MGRFLTLGVGVEAVRYSKASERDAPDVIWQVLEVDCTSADCRRVGVRDLELEAWERLAHGGVGTGTQLLTPGSCLVRDVWGAPLTSADSGRTMNGFCRQKRHGDGNGQFTLSTPSSLDAYVSSTKDQRTGLARANAPHFHERVPATCICAACPLKCIYIYIYPSTKEPSPNLCPVPLAPPSRRTPTSLVRPKPDVPISTPKNLKAEARMADLETLERFKLSSIKGTPPHLHDRYVLWAQPAFDPETCLPPLDRNTELLPFHNILHYCFVSLPEFRGGPTPSTMDMTLWILAFAGDDRLWARIPGEILSSMLKP